MDSVGLGLVAGKLTVYLSRWGDFWGALDAIDPATGASVTWPDGISIELRYYATKAALEPAVTWPANIAGGRAAWHIPKAQALDEVITPNNDTARLIYFSADGAELDWEEGVAKWK